MKYHVFFTTKYTDECLENGKFGATSVNSLGTVVENDIAFLFDGLRWKLYGPLKIGSKEQFYDNNDIYGRNRRNIVNYPNRVSFSTDQIKELSLSKLFALEKDINSKDFIINRVIQSVMIANKQIHSTPLTNEEGEYLHDKINNGIELKINKKSDNLDHISVLDNLINSRKTKSEAIFELLLLKGRYNKDCFNLSDYDIVYNQFVLGFQRQTDILAIKNGECLLIELKKKDNKTNPYPQIKEYEEYINSDSRLKPFNIKSIKSIALLEKGNKYINSAQKPLVFEMTIDYKLKICCT